MEWVQAFIDNWLLDAAGHFWLAFFAGLLAFWLMQIILYVPLSITYNLRRLPVSRGAIYGILILSLLLGISLALWSHALLDGFVSWYQAPSGPPLGEGL